MRRFTFTVMVLAWLALFLTAVCPAEAADYASPDYAEAERWLHLPDNGGDLPVDVIYLYPTAWTPRPGDDRMYCDIDEESMLDGARYAYELQASVFEPAANVYAPFYRQINIDQTLGKLTLEEQNRVLAETPARDVTAALDYYFARYNNGKPFILAGHSQGTQVTMVAWEEYFRLHPELRERMIAAYLIGYSVTPDYLAASGLQFAAGADDTGVVVSWNTEAAPGALGNPVVQPGAMAINPLNWKKDGTPADVSQNLGSLTRNDQGEYVVAAGVADATLDPERGVILASVYPDGSLGLLPNPPFPAESLHRFDYQFYYMNIRQNVQDRVRAYFSRSDSSAR